MEGWGPDCHKWTGASMARPAEKCGHTIIPPPKPFGTIRLLTRLSRIFQRSIINDETNRQHYAKKVKAC
jgi:hypothetical protein